MKLMMIQKRRLELPSSSKPIGIAIFLLVWMMIFGSGTTAPTMAQACLASPHAFFVKQFEETISLKIKGDEHKHWVTDMDDYTVVQNSEGDYRYAELSSDRKKLVPTDKKVGKSSKQHSKSKGWEKDITPDKDDNDDGDTDTKIILEGGRPAVIDPTSFKRRGRCPRGGSSPCGDKDKAGDIPFAGSLRNKQGRYEPNDSNPGRREEQHHRRTATAQTIGTLKNLVILLKFEDHKDQKRPLPSKEDVTVLMNSENNDPVLAPTGSLKMVYLENSYGQLTIESEVTDWINVSNSEIYYANGRSGIETQEKKFHEALKDALDQLEEDDFDFTKFDENGDDYIDSITFLTSGYGAEWGGEDEYGTSYGDRIWSHKWNIEWQSIKTGVRVTDYHVSPSLWGTSGRSIGRVGVIAHEIGHFLGLPDLYDTDSGGYGLGFFCMMANSWGYDGSQRYPPHMSGYSKAKLGWIMPQTPRFGEDNRVARSEGYTTSEAPHQVYKIGDGKFGFPPNEYLMIEYRKTDWLKGGIAIYHVDEQPQNYNREGYPGQIEGNIEWPLNGNHYKIALLAADGNYELEKGVNQGNSEDLFNISQSLLPSNDKDGPFPNTDSYQKGNITQTGVQIYVTSNTEKSYMTFLFSDENNAVQPWQELQLVLSEDFNSELKSETISFGSTAKVVEKDKCKGVGCVKIKRNKPTSTMLIKIAASSLSKVQVDFDFYTGRFKNGDSIVLEYSIDSTPGGWGIVQSWDKGGVNTFSNREWVSTTTLNWVLPEKDSSSIVLRFRTTSKKNIFIDNVIVRVQ